MFAALERPQIIGGIAMLSPSINGPPSFYAPLLRGERTLPAGTRVWISAGSYEGAIIDDARLMEGLFRAGGLEVHSRYTSEGHGFPTWRNQLPEMLAFFFPPAVQARR